MVDAAVYAGGQRISGDEPATLEAIAALLADGPEASFAWVGPRPPDRTELEAARSSLGLAGLGRSSALAFKLRLGGNPAQPDPVVPDMSLPAAFVVGAAAVVGVAAAAQRRDSSSPAAS